MQHLKEFLTHLQTFNLRITKQEVVIKSDPAKVERQQGDAYDITHETQYYDSFSYKSELRVLKDMALIDLLTLDDGQIGFQLEQLQKVAERFKQLWKNYHDNHSEWLQDYKSHYLFTIRLDTLFIVHNLRGDGSGIAITGQFVEDLGDSIKLRELFLKELIADVGKRLEPSNPKPTLQQLLHPSPISVMAVTEPAAGEPAKAVSRYPTFTAGTAKQLLHILKDYFVAEDHIKLEKLLLDDEASLAPLVFRGNGNQLADAFKQLYDANMIVGCQQTDLEKWLVTRFMYLSLQGEPREFTEGYLNDLISTKGRPCKSPILKIEQKDDKFLILPVPRNKK
jgi:hypothetical protein